jgi:AcrR family transcriptional regulator
MAALREFAAKGYAGARVDSIARRSRANKRMLYHYFGNKADLFLAVLTRKMAEKSRLRQALPPGGFAAALPYAFEMMCQDPDWVRLLQWEALERRTGPVVAEKERRRAFEAVKAAIAREQAAGLLPSDLDPGHLLLAFLSLAAFPLLAPQAVRLIAGTRPTDPTFRRQRAEFLHRLVEHLRPGRRVDASSAAARRIL